MRWLIRWKLALIVFLVGWRFSDGFLSNPRQTKTRNALELPEFWQFSFQNVVGLSELSYGEDDWEITAVPSSFNGLGAERRYRHPPENVWYMLKEWQVPGWVNPPNQEIYLHFAGAGYHTEVYANSHFLGSHETSQLPFFFKLPPPVLSSLSPLTIHVKISNTLNTTTIPPGTQDCYKSDTFAEQCIPKYQQDFFNFGGIHRQVRLLTIPRFGAIKQEFKIFAYQNGSLVRFPETPNLLMELSRGDQKWTTAETRFSGLPIEPWYPIGYGKQPLYKLRIFNEFDEIVIPYIGFRTISISKEGGIFVNEKSIKIHGTGRHEDWITRGKGYDAASLIQDFNLMKWLGLNTFRTSHYPYSVETMELASKLGFLVIDELPTVGMKEKRNFGPVTTELALSIQNTLMVRDFNYPAVVMWSIGNEPDHKSKESLAFFGKLARAAKAGDVTRPVTVVVNSGFDVDHDRLSSMEEIDVICNNDYFGWYHMDGQTDEAIFDVVVQRVKKWRNAYPTKPFIHSEWGAGALPGLHTLPSQLFTEDYQSQIMKIHKNAFYHLWKTDPGFAGHMVWNFADFETAHSHTRVAGNKKGLFTQDRKPKAAAFTFKNEFADFMQIKTNGGNSKLSFDRRTSNNDVL